MSYKSRLIDLPSFEYFCCCDAVQDRNNKFSFPCTNFFFYWRIFEVIQVTLDDETSLNQGRRHFRKRNWQTLCFTDFFVESRIYLTLGKWWFFLSISLVGFSYFPCVFFFSSLCLVYHYFDNFYTEKHKTFLWLLLIVKVRLFGLKRILEKERWDNFELGYYPLRSCETFSILLSKNLSPFFFFFRI